MIWIIQLYPVVKKFSLRFIPMMWRKFAATSLKFFRLSLMRCPSRRERAIDSAFSFKWIREARRLASLSS
jgi:hypothetical protein